MCVCVYIFVLVNFFLFFFGGVDLPALSIFWQKKEIKFGRTIVVRKSPT